MTYPAGQRERAAASERLQAIVNAKSAVQTNI